MTKNHSLEDNFDKKKANFLPLSLPLQRRAAALALQPPRCSGALQRAAVCLKMAALQRCGAFKNLALQCCALQRSAAARSGAAAHSASLQCVPIPGDYRALARSFFFRRLLFPLPPRCTAAALGLDMSVGFGRENQIVYNNEVETGRDNFTHWE
jgi:hypothetical protein